jgi:hypothetical protein
LIITFEYFFSKLFSLHLQKVLHSFFEFHSLELQPIPIVFVLSQSTRASMLPHLNQCGISLLMFLAD